MVKVIMLSGASGTGKSWLLEKYSTHFFAVDVEKLQYDAVIAELGPTTADPHGWTVWNDNMQSKAAKLLGDAFELEYPAKKFGHNDTIMLAGSLLACDWNRQAWLQIVGQRSLEAIFPHYLMLAPSPEVVCNQIISRGRPKETHLHDIEAVRTHLEGYLKLAGSIWETVPSTTLAQTRIEQLK